jgi:hypothetical protein
MKQLPERYAGLGHICFALDVYGKGVRGDPSGDNAQLMVPFCSTVHFSVAGFWPVSKQPSDFLALTTPDWPLWDIASVGFAPSTSLAPLQRTSRRRSASTACCRDAFNVSSYFGLDSIAISTSHSLTLAPMTSG